MMSNSKDAAAVETESIQDKAMSHRSENETSCSVNQLIDMKKEDTTDLTDMIKPDNPEAVSTSSKRLNRMRVSCEFYFCSLSNYIVFNCNVKLWL